MHALLLSCACSIACSRKRLEMTATDPKLKPIVVSLHWVACNVNVDYWYPASVSVGGMRHQQTVCAKRTVADRR